MSGDGDKKRIGLITPPSPFLLDERVFMSLGILRIAASLRREGHDVEHLDLAGIDNYEEALRDFARSTSVDVFGVTATTPQMPQAYIIGGVLREERPDATTILGGPHPTLVYAARKKMARGRTTNDRPIRAARKLEDRFDRIVLGDGEYAIFEAIKDGAPQIIDADDPKSEWFLTNGTYEELPFPARDLVDVDSYHYHIDGERALSMISQLGCPFECGYCSGRESPFLRRVRRRSVDSVVAEMEEIHTEYGVNGIMMYDDELNISGRSLVDLMKGARDLQDRRGVEFRLRGFIKSELFDEEQAIAMYRAGFREILVGFESGSPRILDNINKKSTREDNSRCVQIARDNGLRVKALMSLGHPGESERTADETQSWLLEARPDDFDVTIITTYPGTPYFDWATSNPDGTYTFRTPKGNGDALHQVEVDHTMKSDYFKGDPSGGYTAYVFTDNLDRDRLVEVRDRIEQEVRRALGIRFNPSAAAINYEHSMGQGLPSNILRTTDKVAYT